MNQLKDPFEAAYEEQEDSPPDSPLAADELEAGPSSHHPPPPAPPGSQGAGTVEEDDETAGGDIRLSDPSSSAPPSSSARNKGKLREEDEDEEEDNMEVELAKLRSTADPDKMAKMQEYCFYVVLKCWLDRLSGVLIIELMLMMQLLVSITGTQKISLQVNIVVCGIAKMFVGEVVETARIVMAERRESGPIRPCHLREAYRRLKLEGKIPKRSVPRLFR
ncbi:Transcription initiation factor TFIID subunit 11 [Linum grandiflorum]